ncbi:hypothetical protein II906_11990, partial [bacterium]|nr:hypothetical protein [bacterium]
MKVAPINSGYSNNFKANLWVDKSVDEVVGERKDVFVKAADQFDEWLRTEKADVPLTMNIRKNTALQPKVAIDRVVEKMSYAYPFEETGHPVLEREQKYEDLEFEMGTRKFGFWFDKDSSPAKLLDDFKT